MASDGDGDKITFTFEDQTEPSVLTTFWLDEHTGVLSLRRVVDAENTSAAGPYFFQVRYHIQNTAPC